MPFARAGKPSVPSFHSTTESYQLRKRELNLLSHQLALIWHGMSRHQGIPDQTLFRGYIPDITELLKRLE